MKAAKPTRKPRAKTVTLWCVVDRDGEPYPVSASTSLAWCLKMFTDTICDEAETDWQTLRRLGWRVVKLTGEMVK